jgi:predicted DNA-binding transcriptional regulator YafY
VLIFKQKVWYVYAFCRTKKDFRTFKIGRIKSARFTGERFVKREINKEDIPLNFYFTSEQLIDVKLQIESNALADVEEWIGIDNINTSGEQIYASVSLPYDEEIIQKLLSFGGKVKVLSPQSLQERVKESALEVLRLY